MAAEPEPTKREVERLVVQFNGLGIKEQYAAVTNVCDLALRAIEQRDEAREGVADLLNQFAYESSNPAGLTTGGSSALEHGFRVLRWTDPHPTPHRACDDPGCGRHASCGWPSPAGYRRTCGEHWERAPGDHDAETQAAAMDAAVDRKEER